MPHPDEKAASYIPQIQAAYDDVVTAEGSALEEKIKLGKLLTGAKEAVQHGKWKAWFGEHFSETISYRSAAVYMQLAANIKKLGKTDVQRAAFLVKHGSMREALREARTPAEKAAAKAAAQARAANRQTKTAALTQPASPASPDLKDLLPSIEVDEVYGVLREAWDDDKLNRLAELLTAPPQSDDLDIRNTPLDRTDEQPAQTEAVQ